MVSCIKKCNLTIHEPNDTTFQLAQKLSCSVLQAAVLETKGVTLDTPLQIAWTWNKPVLPDLLDKLYLGARSLQAAETLRNISPGAKVVVYGDYDVDGISATSVAMDLVLFYGASVRFYIPHRFKQGYGFHVDVARDIVKINCDLVIVVDCGTHDDEAISILRDANVPVVVFDHHLVEGQVANANAIVNPQIDGDEIAKKLCATGVIWSWIWQTDLLPKTKLLEMIDVVALATVADCMPLSSPLNRAIVSQGTEQLKRTKRIGLKTLMNLLDVSLEWLDTEDMSMKIIPCLNAAGRLYFADAAVNVLCGIGNVVELASELVSLNKKRRNLSTKILEEIKTDSSCSYRYVLFSDTWYCGVLSSVASRVCVERNSPIALVANVGEIMRGTLRMPQGGDAVSVLKELAPLLKSWGGHKLAAGFSVLPENWQELRDGLEEKLAAVIPTEEKLSVLLWNPSEFDRLCWHDITSFGPFGIDNLLPLFYVPLTGDELISELGHDNKHSKIKISHVTILAFGVPPSSFDNVKPIGLVYKPRIDTWRNVPKLQFVLEKLVVD
ncbi:MAG: DHH family phosphoesterase [Synergistaceae bacterium]|nr:DHH family phosphoesterase [Synergistaceae bacterium]